MSEYDALEAQPLPEPAPAPPSVEQSVEFDIKRARVLGQETAQPQDLAAKLARVESGGAPFDHLVAATYNGLVKDPARAARVLAMRDKVGMPSDFVDRNLDELETETRRADFNPAEFRKTAPMVANWLEKDVQHSGLSREDLPRLAAVERFVAESPNYKFGNDGRIYEAGDTLGQVYQTPAELLKELRKRKNVDFLASLDRQMTQERYMDQSSFVAGFQGAGGSTLRALTTFQRGRDTSVDDQMEEAMAASQANNPGFLSAVARGAGGLSADAPLMLAGSAIAPLARLKQLYGASKAGTYAAGATAAAIASQPLSIREGILVGEEHGWANGLAAWGIETGVTGAFGLTGREKIIESLVARGVSKEAAPTLTAAAFDLLKQSALEATGEATTELAHAMHERISGIDPNALDGDRLAPRLALAGVLGAGAGAAFNAPGVIAELTSRPHGMQQNLQKLDAALSNADMLVKMTTAAAESSTAKLYEPEGKRLFQSILSAGNKFPEMFLDPAAWTKLATDAKLDPRNAIIDMIAAPGQNPGAPASLKAAAEAAAMYDDAVRTGSPLRIKTADLAFWLGKRTKQDDFVNAVQWEVRTDPMAMNAREVEELFAANEAQDQTTQEPGKGVEKSEARQVSDVKAEIESALVAAGFDPAAAATNADVESRFWRSIAAQYNKGKPAGDPNRLTPAQLWKEWNVQVIRPATGVLATQESQTPDQIIAANKAALDAARIDEASAQADADTDKKTDAVSQAKADLLARAKGKDGDEIIARAVAEVEKDTRLFRRKLGTGDMLRALGPDFGFRADSKQKLSPEQIAAGELFIAAIRVRGIDLQLMADEAASNLGDSFQQTEPELAEMPDVIDVDGKMRSTLNSNGKRIAATEEGVRNFWKWFGDSKVVDENGRPRVMYHGTTSTSGFSEFKGGYFTSEIERANSYTEDFNPQKFGTFDNVQSGVVYQVYLHIEKPTIRPEGGAQNLKDAGEGRDGVIGIGRGRRGIVATVSAPSQVKSVTGNRGTFDPSNPSILYQTELPPITPESATASLESWIASQPEDIQAIARQYLPQIDVQNDAAGALGNLQQIVIMATPRRRRFQEESTKYQQQTYAAIDFFGGPGSRRTVVSLFDAANLSSFAHESAHLHLEVLFDLANRPSASPEIKADFATAYQYLGNDVAVVRNEALGLIRSDRRLTTDEQRSEQIAKVRALTDDQIRDGMNVNEYTRAAFHERWARSWEAYLMEGKAPTPELRTIFARFAAWLSYVYKEGVRRLGVTLTPEIRSVMDRMVATQEEIDTALSVLGDDGFVQSAKDIGLSEEQAGAIDKSSKEAVERAQSQLLADHMKVITREKYQYYKELKDKMRSDVAKEVYQDKTYIAASVLRRGKLPNGDANATTPKLSSASVKAHLAKKHGRNEAQMKADRSRLTGMISIENGITVDEAATIFGFPSADAFMDALTTVRPIDDVIKAITDDRMRDKYGDPLVDGSAADLAMDALHGDHVADVYEAKIKALAARTGQRAAPVEVMRQAATAKIDATKSGDIRPSIYLSAEVKARRRVQQALAKQDWAGALVAKQSELLNHELYKAAKEAQANVEKAVDHARSFDEDAKRKRIGKAGGWEWTVTNPDGSQSIHDTEAEARSAAFQTQGTFTPTSGYLENIDAVRDNLALNRTTRQANSARTLDQWVKQQAEQGSIVTIDPRLVDAAAKKDWRDATVAEILAMSDALSHLEHMASVKNKMTAASAKRDFAELREELVKQLEDSHPSRRKALAEVKMNEAQFFSKFIAIHTKTASIARSMDGGQDLGPWARALLTPMNEAGHNEAAMIGDGLAKQEAMWDEWTKAIKDQPWKAGQRKDFDGFEGGLTRVGSIMVALNWGNADNQNRLLVGQKVTRAQVLNVLDSLSSEDWNLVEKVWEHIDSYWSEISALERRVTGNVPEKVEAIPFDTKFGTMRGGYFPIVYNLKDAPINYIASEDLAAQVAGLPTSRPQTKHGHTEARAAGGTGSPLVLDPAVIGRHLNMVIHDLTHREAVRDVSRLLSDKTIAAEISSRMSTADLQQLKAWVFDIATSNSRGRAGTGAEITAWLRKGFSFSAMAFNPTTAALQLTGFSNGAARVGAGYVANALTHLHGTTEGMPTLEFIQKQSVFMKHRSRTMTQEMAEIYSGVYGKIGIKSVMDASDKYGFWLMRQTQGEVDNTIWLAAYTKAQEGGRTDDDSVRIADQAVIDTQGSGLVKDLSGVQRSAFLQAFTGAYTYGAIIFNQYHNIAANFRQDVKASYARAFVRAFTATMLTTMLPAAMTLALRELLRKQPEKKKDPIEERYAAEVASTVLGSMVVVRELSGAAQGYSYSGPAVVSPIGSAIDLLRQSFQGNLDRGFVRALNDTVGGLAGLPSGQVWRTATGLEYLLDNPSIDLRPIFTGPPLKK